MIFTSYAFVFMFLPVVYGIYRGLNTLGLRTAGKVWLVSSSLYFFAQASPRFLPWFVGMILLNYLLGRALLTLEKGNGRGLLLFLGLVLNPGLLVVYKYTDFVIANANRLLQLQIPLQNWLMPIGLSYFAFQMTAWLVDCYDRKAKAWPILDFLLFACFFPQLLMGPIARHNEIIPQFQKEAQLRMDWDFFCRGLFLFSVGLGKKVLLATPLLSLNSFIFFGETLQGPLVFWVGLFVNLTALYFDFSGYTDMAIGLACLFNIRLSENFNSPYKARNFQDYWKRWHMSLTKFLTEYVFNRIYRPGMGTIWFYAATLLTFLISGLWHGSGWTYIFWGLFHGLAVCGVAFTALHIERRYLMKKFPARVLTMIGLGLAGALYICNGISHFLQVLKNLFSFRYYLSHSFQGELYGLITGNFYGICILILSLLICFYGKNARQMADASRTDRRYPIFAAVVLVLSLFAMGSTSDFVYMQF